MKATSAQIFSAATHIVAAYISENRDRYDFASNDDMVCCAVKLATKIAEAVPDVNHIPSDDEIKEACIQLVDKEKPIGASLLGNLLASQFNIQLTLAYTLIQKAVQLGYITPTHEGKNKTVYTLA